MQRNILFLVTGRTPQVITETIWALACDPNNDKQWVPDEVHVLSTQDGLNQISKRLFEEGVLEQFKQDYPKLRQLMFNEKEHFHVITDKSGTPLFDLKTPEDNECSADIICELIKNFTNKANTSVHVSIAGGRKTMGFYAGYALSLYGRVQDSLSHVLVEEKYERAVNFFYPTSKKYLVSDRDCKVVGNAQDAKVWLANIPFVRMRDAILPKHQLKNENESFSDVVHKINESFNPVKLVLNAHNRTIEVNDKYTINNLPPREFAFLYWFASKRKHGQEGIIAPKKNMSQKDIDAEQLQYISEITRDFFNFYRDYKDDENIDISVDKKFFETTKSRLQTSLQQELGVELAAKIAIKQHSRNKPFYLDINPASIKLVDKFLE